MIAKLPESATPRRLSFTVPVEPVPMARPRVALRGGRPHGYTPTKTARSCWEIRQCALAALGSAEPFAGPLSVTVVVFLRMPGSVPKRDRLTALPAKRPDLDNYVKCLLDGLSPLWGDDSQVVDLVARKRYAVTGSPRWDIAVEAVG